MNVLVLGGARFIGRHIVERLLAGGHQVTTLSRGKSPDELPSEVERLIGDRDDPGGGVAALAGRTWDACVDVSGYTPRQVRPSAEALGERVSRYVFVSTVSVYEDGPDVPVLETHPLLPAAAEDVSEITGETYGPLKVTCERIVTAVYGSRSTILRPQIVAGPHDPTGRHTYWVQRASEGGEMLAPGDGSDHLQLVDVRDIARFVCNAVELNIDGVFNMAGPRITWARFLEILDPVGSVVWVDADLMEAEGLTFVEMPLYRPDGASRSSLMYVSHDRASAAGLTLTDPAVTARDVRQWLRQHPVKPALDPAIERQLIAKVRERDSWR
jgi:2'-hydroxyisoflavone reductase